MNVRVALAQLPCVDGDMEANFKRVEEVVTEHGPSHDFVVFPESYLTGFPPREVTRALAQPLDGPIIRRLGDLAKRCGVRIVVGLVERDGDKVYNTTVLVAPGGLELSYRKTHLWVGEAQRVEPGDYFRVRAWNGTKLGLLICYDIEFPEAARAVSELGAEIIFLTNGNMDPYGPAHRTALMARAQENQVYAVMVNRVGYQGSTLYVGESAVADPYGRILAEAGSDEQILSVNLDLAMVYESRQKYDYLHERRVPLAIQTAEIDRDVWQSTWDRGE